MLNGLMAYNAIIKDPVIKALLDGDREGAIRELIGFAEGEGVCGDVLKYYILNALALDDNVFSRTAELKGICGSSLKLLAKKDIDCIIAFILEHNGIISGYQPTVEGRDTFFRRSILDLKKAFETGADEALDALMAHYASLGRGISAKYEALSWNGSLNGVEDFDDISLDELIDIERQKEILIKNTESFLKHEGANNVLLFGDSGTGKSSSVKALINRYKSDGLRLVEMSKFQLDDLPEMLKLLKNSRHRYIVFLDDLSFEDNEPQYKYLKAALEGKASVTPENVLFYATSNRRHLIKETWADRALEREEVRISDTMQEKMSLSERFGITVVFISPNQEQYLAIIKDMLKKRKTEFTEDLKLKAVQWELNYNGRSGRTAKQFVNSLKLE